MNTLLFIGLLGLFSYNCATIGNEWKGRSTNLKTAYVIGGALGYLLWFASLIWSFWHFDWWQPILLFIATIFISGLSAIIFQKNLIGMILSLIGLLTFGGIVIGVIF